jgi:hypothetical protein
MEIIFNARKSNFDSLNTVAHPRPRFLISVNAIQFAPTLQRYSLKIPFILTPEFHRKPLAFEHSLTNCFLKCKRGS